MPKEKPSDWVYGGRKWPAGPFRKPPEGSSHDLVEVEQLARITAELKTVYEGNTMLSHRDWADAALTDEFTVSKILGGQAWPPLPVLLRMAAAAGLSLYVGRWPRPTVDDVDLRVEDPDVRQPARVVKAYRDVHSELERRRGGQ